MNTKMLIGALIGAIVFFFSGWLVYGILLVDTMATFTNTACSRPMEEMNMGLMVAGNLGFGLLYAYILSSSSKFASLSGGAVGGAIIGLLMSFSYDTMIYAQSTMMTSYTGVIYDMVSWTVLSVLAGAAIGWWLGRK